MHDIYEAISRRCISFCDIRRVYDPMRDVGSCGVYFGGSRLGVGVNKKRYDDSSIIVLKDFGFIKYYGNPCGKRISFRDNLKKNEYLDQDVLYNMLDDETADIILSYLELFDQLFPKFGPLDYVLSFFYEYLIVSFCEQFDTTEDVFGLLFDEYFLLYRGVRVNAVFDSLSQEPTTFDSKPRLLYLRRWLRDIFLVNNIVFYRLYAYKIGDKTYLPIDYDYIFENVVLDN